MNNKDIGKRIKALRKEMKITQAELAKKTGIAEITIRQYESGMYLPKYDKLQKIAAALGVSVSDLSPTIVHIDYGKGHKEYIMKPDSEGNNIFKPLDSDNLYTARGVNIARIEMNEDYLNDAGIKKLADYSFDLVQSGNYKRDPESDDEQT